MTSTTIEFFPSHGTIELDAIAERAAAMRRAASGRPFGEDALAFLGSLSGRLLAEEVRSKHPQLAALGFWIRRPVLAQLANRYQSRAAEDSAMLVARGLVFHLPPANVDVMFAYSWFLSLLAGNANLIRLPGSLNPAARLLLDIVAREAVDFRAITDSSLLLHYAHSAAANRVVSEQCDARAVWGGDAKVLDLRTVPLPPRAIQIEFADRFSYAAFNVHAYVAASEIDRSALASRFFNDIFWFDQMGCASPRIVFWVGDREEAKAAAKDLWSRLAVIISSKGYSVDASTAIAKLAYADRFTLDRPVEAVHRLSNELTVISLTEPVDFRGHVMGAGMMTECYIGSLCDIASFVAPKDQTLVQFGFQRHEIEDLLTKSRGRGLDRVVPIGRALDFHHLWDGHDLITSLCRVVHVV
jgi:hypothetical protein